ncbi:unnamed protein product [Amoebophrya sp. A25]|nr:unnamed protein product [Amoebophrya sp. A25]|eukprot:GSA25T00003970001.1
MKMNCLSKNITTLLFLLLELLQLACSSSCVSKNLGIRVYDDAPLRPIAHTQNLFVHETSGAIIAKSLTVADLAIADDFTRRRNGTQRGVHSGFAFKDVPENWKTKANVHMVTDAASLKRQKSKDVIVDREEVDLLTENGEDVGTSTTASESHYRQKHLPPLPPNTTAASVKMDPKLRFVPVKNPLGYYELISYTPPPEEEAAENDSPLKKSLFIEIGANSRNLLMDESYHWQHSRESAFLVSFEPLLDKWALLLSLHRGGHDSQGPGRVHDRALAFPLAVGPCRGDHSQEQFNKATTFTSSSTRTSSSSVFDYVSFNVMDLDGLSSMLQPAEVPRPDDQDDLHGSPRERLREVKEERRVPCVSLERVLTHWFPEFDEVSVLKVDAQGVDVDVVKSASKETLQKRVKRIELEVLCDNRPMMYEGSGSISCSNAVAEFAELGFVPKEENICARFSGCKGDEMPLVLLNTNQNPMNLDETTTTSLLVDKGADGGKSMGSVSSTTTNRDHDHEQRDDSLRADLQLTTGRHSRDPSSQDSFLINIGVPRNLNFPGAGAGSSGHLAIDTATVAAATTKHQQTLTLEPNLRRYALAMGEDVTADTYNQLGEAGRGSKKWIVPLGFCSEANPNAQACISADHFFTGFLSTFFGLSRRKASLSFTVSIDFFRFSHFLGDIFAAAKTFLEQGQAHEVRDDEKQKRHSLRLILTHVPCDHVSATPLTACERIRAALKKRFNIEESAGTWSAETLSMREVESLSGPCSTSTSADIAADVESTRSIVKAQLSMVVGVGHLDRRRRGDPFLREQGKTRGKGRALKGVPSVPSQWPLKAEL